MTALNWKPAPALRSPEYLAWVRSQPSVESGQYGCIAHHPVGHGRLSTLKCSDYFAIPLTDAEHKVLHDKGWKAWEERNGSQLEHAARIMEQAIREGVLCLDKRAAKYMGGTE
jgi:hypothetical protein